MAGNDEVALQELSTTSDVRARGYLAAAYAGTGRSAEALALADTLLQPPVDTTVPWEIIVGRLGRHDPEAASELTSRVALESSLPATMRARLLAADAVRFDGFDSIRVHRRLFQAESIATGTTVQGDIVLLRARLLLRDETDPARLRQHAGQLVEVAEAGGPVAPVLFRIAATLDRAVQVAESVPAGAPLGDLRLFLAAESVRDSAGAKAFARGPFERIPEGWPDSPYAAKAVMALKDLNPDASDSLDHLLASRYGGSPYVAAASGGDGREILVLEDSLRRYAATLSRPTRPQPARPGQRPRPQPARPAEELP
jgi:hypothetical protein